MSEKSWEMIKVLKLKTWNTEQEGPSRTDIACFNFWSYISVLLIFSSYYSNAMMDYVSTLVPITN
jgi:hypothetical protein